MLSISNFSLSVDEYAEATASLCVDVSDSVNNVVTSGTYFIIDGVVTSGTFTPTGSGYVMCYDPVDDFSSLLGLTEFKVHAENDNSEGAEESFYLTSGYLVEYDNIDNDYGYGNQVVVSMAAENLASCPNIGADAYFFTTEIPNLTRNLGASITGISDEEYRRDLSAVITADRESGTILFYGKVFTIEVRAKDFAGNEMDPYIFQFKIEDKQ
jgi:hypothetical protein